MRENITNQQWLEDIDYLQKELPKRHKNIYHTLKKEDFKKEISNLKNRISELEGYEIKYELSKIIANIGDAHTFLDPGFTQNEKLYPLITAWYGGELRVIGTHKKYKNFIGKELIGINNISIEDIMKKVNSLISHENEQWLKVENVDYILRPNVLKFLNITSDDTIKVSLRNDSDKVEKVEIEPEKLSNKNMVTIKEMLPENPSWPQQNGKNKYPDYYWYRFMPEDKILYFQYNKCKDRNIVKDMGKMGKKVYGDYRLLPDFNKFSEGLIGEINNKDIEKFIIDLRYNRGGVSTLMTSLADKLNKIERIKGKTFVITGKETYSSGVMHAWIYKGS